jgi:hypothetical protein
MNEMNQDTKKNLKRLCRMLRAWKEFCSVPMSGILIDTLAYKFIGDWQYRDKSYLYYDFMSRDFFSYVHNLDSSQTYWLAPGSSRPVYKSGEFQYKALLAYNKSLEAIKVESEDTTAKAKWREIYGSRFPK